MARFVQDLALNKPDDFVYFIMNDYLQKNGFVMSDWKGEPAYKAGDGVMEGYKYLKWSYGNGMFHLEAWLRGSFGGEMDLDGFVGCLMKKSYKANIMELLSVLQQPLPQQPVSAGNQAQGGEQAQEAAAQGGQVPFQNGPMPNVIPVKTVDHYKAAQTALILGILSIVIGLFIPLAGIILSCIGFSRARMGQSSSKADMAKAGKICCIVGIALSAGIWLLNLFLSVLQVALL